MYKLYNANTDKELNISESIEVFKLYPNNLAFIDYLLTGGDEELRKIAKFIEFSCSS